MHSPSNNKYVSYIQHHIIIVLKIYFNFKRHQFLLFKSVHEYLLKRIKMFTVRLQLNLNVPRLNVHHISKD